MAQNVLNTKMSVAAALGVVLAAMADGPGKKQYYDQWERAPGPGGLRDGSALVCVLPCQTWSSMGTRAKARSGVRDGSRPWPGAWHCYDLLSQPTGVLLIGLSRPWW